MSEIRRIGAFYSAGPHFLRMLTGLREAHPAAEIVVLIPPDYPRSEDLEALADAVLTTERTHYAMRDVRACRRLVKQLRQSRYDLFAVMFDSNQLRLLAALSGAPRCVHGTMGGRLAPLGRSVTRALAGMALRNLWGRMVYATVWLAVHCLPVRTGPHETGAAGRK